MSDITPEPKTENAPAALSEGAEMWKKAEALSRADIIPKRYQGNPGNCFVALEMASRMPGAGSFEVMQNLNVINGEPHWASSYCIARANHYGPFIGPITFETTGSGDDMVVTASATVEHTGQTMTEPMSMKQANTAGWTRNKAYQSYPAQMLAYRAATFMIRKLCPEVMLGLKTVEEAQDIHAARTVDAEIVSSPVAQINAKIEPPVDPDNAPEDLKYEEPEKVEAAPDMDDSHSTLYGDE